MGKVPKQWKNGGEEDKFIIKLMKQNKINKYTKPSTLQTDYPHLFNDFSSNVIRNHLNTLKRTNGLYLGQQDEDDEIQETDLHHREISETSNDSSNDSSKIGFVDNVHQNYPVLCDTFKDPDNQCEKLVLAVTIPSGVQNIKIELNDDGTIAFIKYSWPKTMYEIDDLYKKDLAAGIIDIHHPKILSLQNALENVRKRIDAAPDSSIKINLPIKVQTALDSWTKSGVQREDGTKIITAEFTGYIKDYNKKSSDSTVIFNK